MKAVKIVLLSVFFLLVSSQLNVVSAEVIRSFDVAITAHQDGKMTITEKIQHDFEGEQRHGIFRKIPYYSKVGDLWRKSEISFTDIKRNGQKETFETSTVGEYVQAKIGDGDKTVSGSQLYEITYEVVNGIGSNYEDHDEIYWNITGAEWGFVIEKASAVITTDFGVNPTRSDCFTGRQGSKEKNCAVQESQPPKIVTTRALNPYEGLTTVTSFPIGTFPKSTLLKEKPGSIDSYFSNVYFISFLIFGFLFLNILLPIYLFRWYLNKKNKTRFGPPTVNFDFPEDPSGNRVSPLEAGIMDTAKLDRDDVLATIYDLAIRNYIKIEEVKKDKKLLGLDVGDKKETVIKKLKDYPDVNRFEQTLLDRLFESGDEVEVSSLKTDFYETFQEMEKEAFRELVRKGFYSKNPKNQQAGFLIAAIFSLFLVAPVLAVLLFFLAIKMTGRTPLGDNTDWQIDGLKLFFKGRAREYNWNAENLQFVEKMIPYALSLGYIDQFIKEFQIHYPDYNPTWYHSYSGSYHFNFANSSFIASFNANITVNAPSSSSGFSGGSSGGGGGGGGGGSW